MVSPLSIDATVLQQNESTVSFIQTSSPISLPENASRLPPADFMKAIQLPERPGSVLADSSTSPRVDDGAPSILSSESSTTLYDIARDDIVIA